MGVIKEYIEGVAEGVAVEALLEEYPWFSTARAISEYEAAGLVTLPSGATSSLVLGVVRGDVIGEESEGEIIDRFLGLDDYRIVADEAASDAEAAVLTEAELDDEDDLVSEELAEVYLAQGLKNEAIEIYRKLSLLNTEKSIYFARKIEDLTTNN